MGPNCWARRSTTRTWNTASQCAIAVALSAALGIPAFSQPSNQREIPFENSRMFWLVLVKLEVNGRPAVLIVDTGSNVTIISPDLADVAPGTLDNAASPSRGSGFTGRGVFRRATLKVGSVTWRDHRVVVTDTRELSKSLRQRVDGMLGMDFFSEFELVVVDLKNHKLVLEP